MNIERLLRGTFQRITPNVMGSLPVSETDVKRRKRLPEPVVRFITTAASVALLIGACWGGFAYFRDYFSDPIIHSGNTTPTDIPGTTETPTQPTESQPTETTVPTDPQPTEPLPTDPNPPAYGISEEDAKQIALTYTNYTADEVSILTVVTDQIASRHRVSFNAEGIRYEIAVATTNGRVLEVVLPADARPQTVASEIFAEAEWLRQGLTHFFDTPAQLDLAEIFGIGFDGESQKPTDEETAYLNTVWDASWVERDLMRLPADKMDQVLQQYYGIRLAELDAECFDGLAYMESTDCYYYATGGVNSVDLRNFIAYRTQTLSDGILRIYYYLSYLPNDPGVITLQQIDQNWVILSNQELENLTDPQPIIPPAPEPLKVSDWQLNVEIVDHDTYFSEERNFVNVYSKKQEWFKERNDGTYLFTAALTDTGIVISSDALPGTYTVPDSAKYAGGSLLATDGCSAWLYWSEQILRVDMASGTAKKVIELKKPKLISVQDNAVVYYVRYDDAQNLTIGQLYLPDGHHEVLHQQQIDTYIIGCEWLKSSNGTFAISMYNPEMLEAIRRELANPNSPYMKGDQFDYSEIWEQEGALDKLLDRPFWLEYFQKETGIRAYLKIYCDLSSGKVTQKTGIIDSCKYGSGYPHDHFSPEITTAEEPVASISGWRELDLATWNGGDSEGDFGSYRIVADTLSRGTLCWISDGKVQIVLDTPVSTARKADEFFICVTTDQRILQVSFDGSCVRELYKATLGKIDQVSIAGTHVFFTDGDTIMELDLENDRVRSVLQHPHLLESYFFGEEYDPAGKNRVYFAICNGMFYQQYIVDLETGEIEETFFL